MTHRELPPHEWPRLAGTDLADIGHPSMVPAHVLVVEDDQGRIIAHWSLMQMWHAEGARIMPQYAKSASVGRHLLVGLRELLQQQGATVVYTGAQLGPAGEPVRQLLWKLGATAVPVTPFFWPVVSPKSSQ